MACVSDYLAAGTEEIAMSQVACLLDEIDGKNEIDPRHWLGYHPNIYSKKYDADKLVSELCEKLQKADVTKYSLEMQIWWRDHQKADRERLEHEMKRKKTEEEKETALAKLTPYERKLLGL